MRRWSRLAAVCIAAGMTLAVAGCGQLFQVKGSTSQPTLEELTQRVDQLEAQVSELNAAVAGMGQARGQAATSSAAGQGGAANSAIRAIVTASYLNVHPQPDVSTPRVGVLKQDTVVSVLATEGSWTKIGFRSLQGWVESRYLEKPGTSRAARSSGAAPFAPANSNSPYAPANSGSSAAPANSGSSYAPANSGSSAAPANSGSSYAPASSTSSAAPANSGSSVAPANSNSSGAASGGSSSSLPSG